MFWNLISWRFRKRFRNRKRNNILFKSLNNIFINIFDYTFAACELLSGSIPDTLFGILQGAPASAMFVSTFYRCSNLNGPIPESLFGELSGDLPVNGYSFYFMFNGCSNLTGPSARINGRPLYEIWPDAVSAQVGGMYMGATNLSDYDQIPAAWK